MWVLAAGLPIVTAIFIAGPDAIRNIPKVPGAISETVKGVLYQAWLDKQLTGVWDNGGYQNLDSAPQELLSVELGLMMEQ